MLTLDSNYSKSLRVFGLIIEELSNPSKKGLPPFAPVTRHILSSSLLGLKVHILDRQRLWCGKPTSNP